MGVLAETLETAATWSGWRRSSRPVTDALAASLGADGTKPIVMCHISHVYPAGASLYFTVIAALTPEPAAQWQRAKDAASRAILAAAARSRTITRSAATIAPTSSPRSARWASRSSAPSSARSTRAAS